MGGWSGIVWGGGESTNVIRASRPNCFFYLIPFLSFENACAHPFSRIMTIGGFLMRMKKELINVKGLSEAKIEKMQEACKKLTAGQAIVGGLMTAKELLMKVCYTTILR